MSLWTKSELEAATKGQMFGHWNASGLAIDSRQLEKGDLFIALSAARDGHEFVRSALENGAAGALVSRIPENLPEAFEKQNLLLVENVEQALEDMGQYRRGQVDAKTVAVTGSVGKTSTKDMLLCALSSYGPTHASVKSFNNHWGVPLTLARMPKHTEFAVFEIGMNHPGEIAPLVKQVRPDVAVITNIAPVHLAGFEGEDGIAREKASILEGLGADGVGLVNGDMKYRDFVAEISAHQLKFFGQDDDNHIRVDDIEIKDHHTLARLSTKAQSYQITLPTTGQHHAFNALVVLGVLQEFGLEIDQGLKALEAWKVPEGRGQKFTISSSQGTFILVDESYNANPLSMRAALDAFLLTPAQRHVAILGDMRELGANSAQFHRDLAAHQGIQSLDVVHAVGEEMRAFYDALGNNRGEYFADKNAVLAALPTLFHDGDAIVIKASLGIGLGEVVDALKEMGQTD